MVKPFKKPLAWMNKLSVLYLLVNLEVRFTDILVSILTNIQVNSHNCFMQSLIFLLSLIFSRQARRDFDELVGSCMHMLANEEQQHMEELRAYVVEDDGAWALGENFGDLFSRIFQDSNIPEQARYHLVRILAVAALKDDVILLLHQDRKDHTIMNFANQIERLPPQLQEAIALFVSSIFLSKTIVNYENMK